MQTRRTRRGAVRDRIDAADQAVMARLSAESSPVLDRFLPALSRSADFFVLWIGIAAALAASKDERGGRAALRGLAGMVVASTASNVLAKGLVRRPRPAGEVPPDRRPGRTPVTTSFPSGHAAAAAAFATGVGLEMPALAAPVGALAAAVGMSRVAVRRQVASPARPRPLFQRLRAGPLAGAPRPHARPWRLPRPAP
jgi:membrane-associated phospholipid phosphatase